MLALNAGVFSEDTLRYWKDTRQRGANGQNQTQYFVKQFIELNGQVNGVDDPETVQYEFRVST